MKTIKLEDLVMAHRYLYYVKANPVLSDYEYDQLESFAMFQLKNSASIQATGSDFEGSYTKEQKLLANELLKGLFDLENLIPCMEVK